MTTIKDFKKLTENIEDLPTLPGVAAQLNEMIRNPRTSAQQIGDLISKDQVLTARALKLVNSAFYGFPRRITNITHSIVILGFQKVRDIVLTASIFDTFKGREVQKLNLYDFWQHSLSTAIAAEAIAKELSSPEAPDAFVSGLLHDIGKLIIALFAPREHFEIRGVCMEKNLSAFEGEKEVLGFHHGDIGEWLTNKWKFPEKVVRSIRLHHTPEAARESRELVSIVHIANILARAVDMGSDTDRISVVSSKIWDEMKLDRKKLASFYDSIGEGLSKAKDFFALIPGSSNA